MEKLENEVVRRCEMGDGRRGGVTMRMIELSRSGVNPAGSNYKM